MPSSHPIPRGKVQIASTVKAHLDHHKKLSILLDLRAPKPTACLASQLHEHRGAAARRRRRRPRAQLLRVAFVARALPPEPAHLRERTELDTLRVRGQKHEKGRAGGSKSLPSVGWRTARRSPRAGAASSRRRRTCRIDGSAASHASKRSKIGEAVEDQTRTKNGKPKPQRRTEKQNNKGTASV